MTKGSELKLAMFDLDGTLFDTNKANYLSYKEACSGFCDISENFFYEHCMGKNYKTFLPLLGVEDKENIELIHKRKSDNYKSFFSFIRPNFSLLKIAELFKTNGIKIAIITTASRSNTSALLKFFDYDDFFDLVVTQEMTDKTKPFPDGYLYAMKYFHCTPDESIIFEDSDVGLQAALNTETAVYKIVRF